MRIRAKLTLRNDAMKSARERLGLSQRRLAELAGCSLSYVGALEKFDYSFSQVGVHAENVAAVLMLDVEQVMCVEHLGEAMPNTFTRVADMQLSALSMDSEPFLIDSPTEAPDLRSQLNRLGEAIKTLTERERDIIKMRFGMGNGDSFTYTYDEIGRIFHITRERVRQIEAKAIRNLQHPSRQKYVLGDDAEGETPEARTPRLRFTPNPTSMSRKKARPLPSVCVEAS